MKNWSREALLIIEERRGAPIKGINCRGDSIKGRDERKRLIEIPLSNISALFVANIYTLGWVGYT